MKKRILPFFTVALIAFMLLVNNVAFAADSTIVFKGAEDGFDSQPGSEYTATDLFDSFKNVMPGDRLTETITLKNEASDCDYIKLYMLMNAHDESANPLSSKVAETETVVTMQDFLSKLTMRIYNGDQLLYDDSPANEGTLIDNVLLGTLYKGESLVLRVELDVPIDLGNEYANRIGEVDWVFLAECIEYEKLTVHKVWDDNGYPFRPESITIQLFRNGETHEEIQLSKDNQWTYTWDDLDDRYQWDIKEVVPDGYTATYATEDNKIFITNYMDYNPAIPAGPIDLSVRKIWADENDERGIRPDFVSVTLYKGNRAAAKVFLGDRNDWSYTWSDLDGNADWSVIETGIPKDYTPSYRTKGNVITITNTSKLIQTGQLNWPIPVFGSLGILLVFFGILMMRKKKKNENV